MVRHAGFSAWITCMGKALDEYDVQVKDVDGHPEVRCYVPVQEPDKYFRVYWRDLVFDEEKRGSSIGYLTLDGWDGGQGVIIPPWLKPRRPYPVRCRSSLPFHATATEPYQKITRSDGCRLRFIKVQRSDDKEWPARKEHVECDECESVGEIRLSIERISDTYVRTVRTKQSVEESNDDEEEDDDGAHRSHVHGYRIGLEELEPRSPSPPSEGDSKKYPIAISKEEYSFSVEEPIVTFVFMYRPKELLRKYKKALRPSIPVDKGKGRDATPTSDDSDPDEDHPSDAWDKWEAEFWGKDGDQDDDDSENGDQLQSVNGEEGVERLQGEPMDVSDFTPPDATPHTDTTIPHKRPRADSMESMYVFDSEVQHPQRSSEPPRPSVTGVSAARYTPDDVVSPAHEVEHEGTASRLVDATSSLAALVSIGADQHTLTGTPAIKVENDDEEEEKPDVSAGSSGYLSEIAPPMVNELDRGLHDLRRKLQRAKEDLAEREVERTYLRKLLDTSRESRVRSAKRIKLEAQVKLEEGEGMGTEIGSSSSSSSSSTSAIRRGPESERVLERRLKDNTSEVKRLENAIGKLEGEIRSTESVKKRYATLLPKVDDVKVKVEVKDESPEISAVPTTIDLTEDD
ncbi:hypothetical protein CC2G_007904 [Coprinopsis cinerea AmutBmut pab1-1]|nr:hypothetical protein CC2G_007904 [Coprinopsis cinerea AmutBmut pab1-1]